MRYSVRLHDLVKRDFYKIGEWINEFAGPEVASQRISEIAAAIESLEYFPHRGSIRNEVAPGCRLITAGDKAVITFMVDDAAAEVFIYSVTYGGAEWAVLTRQRRQ